MCFLQLSWITNLIFISEYKVSKTSNPKNSLKSLVSVSILLLFEKFKRLFQVSSTVSLSSQNLTKHLKNARCSQTYESSCECEEVDKQQILRILFWILDISLCFVEWWLIIHLFSSFHRLRSHRKCRLSTCMTWV